jgi:hypothetical protein
MSPKRPVTVTATVIADFVFCPEAWRIAQLGHASANQPAREAGTVRHIETAAVERAAGGSIAVGRILILIALLALAAWVLT